jgi:hypothetical protein
VDFDSQILIISYKDISSYSIMHSLHILTCSFNNNHDEIPDGTEKRENQEVVEDEKGVQFCRDMAFAGSFRKVSLPG